MIVRTRIAAVAFLGVLSSQIHAQTVTGVTGNSNNSKLQFTVSAPSQYKKTCKVVYIDVAGNVIELNATIGSNGTVSLRVPGMLPGDSITVAVTFDLDDGSGGISVQGQGTVQ